MAIQVRVLNFVYNHLQGSKLKRLFSNLKGNGLGAKMLRSSGASAFIQGLSILLSLIAGVLLARILGPEGYGIYGFVLSIITLLGLPANSGLPLLLIREVARSRSGDSWGAVAGLLRYANRFLWVVSVLITVMTSLFLFFLWEERDSNKHEVFIWSLFLLPLSAFMLAREGVLRGLNRVAASQIVGKLVRPFFIILLVGASMYLGRDISPVEAMQFNVLGVLSALVLGVAILAKAMPREINTVTPEFHTRAWSTSLVMLSLFAGIKALDSQVAVLLLGIMSTDEQVGLFRVAVTAATLVSFALTAANMALAPNIARLYHSGDTAKLQRMITLTTRGVAAVSIPVAAVLVIWGEEIIGVVFGSQYMPASSALAVLCIGQLVNASVGSVALVLNMTGNDRSTVLSAVVAVVANVAIEILLIPDFGLIGAAIGCAVSLSIWNIILVIVARKKTGINTYLGAR